MIRPALLVALALCAPAVVHAEAIALTGATVHTVSGPTLENATVVMQDGKIVAVGSNAQVPAGATVVSCAGKHVYPGFIDANSVLGLVEVGSVRGTVDNAEAGDINPNIRAQVQINPESELIPVVRYNGITSALVIPRGGTLSGSSGLIHLDGWTHEDMTIAAPVGLHIQWPNMTPARNPFNPQAEEDQKKARDESLRKLRDAFDDARAYQKALAAEGKSGIPRHDRDVKWDAMIHALNGEIPVMFHARRLNQIRAALKFADQQGLKRIVLVGGDDADLMLDELKERNIAVIAGPTLELPNRSWEAYDKPMALPGKLAAAGIPFCLSNGGSTDNSAANGRNLPYQAGMAAAYGLPKDEALKSITLYPARLLGVGDKLGSIETGKVADLMVTNGDPLEITTTVEQVYISGKPVSMQTRQTRLFHKYDQRPRKAKTLTQTSHKGGGAGSGTSGAATESGGGGGSR